MKKIDMRFDQSMLKTFVGEKFVKYRNDPFIITNSVTGTVGIYIGQRVFELRNEQEAVDFFGHIDDYAVFKLIESAPDKIESFYMNVTQIDTPIHETVQKIIVVNENQRMFKNGIQTYDVWLTRGVVFFVGGREISFQKDVVPFSEEIFIQKGYDLINEFDGTDNFLTYWEDDIGFEPECDREYITIG